MAPSSRRAPAGHSKLSLEFMGAVKQREIEECSFQVPMSPPPRAPPVVDRRANCIAGNSRGSFLKGRFINIDQSPITPPLSSTPLNLAPDPKDERHPTTRAGCSRSQNVPEVSLLETNILRCLCNRKRDVNDVKMVNRLWPLKS